MRIINKMTLCITQMQRPRVLLLFLKNKKFITVNGRDNKMKLRVLIYNDLSSHVYGCTGTFCRPAASIGPVVK